MGAIYEKRILRCRVLDTICGLDEGVHVAPALHRMSRQSSPARHGADSLKIGSQNRTSPLPRIGRNGPAQAEVTAEQSADLPVCVGQRQNSVELRVWVVSGELVPG
jgi:hypothetical protein